MVGTNYIEFIIPVPCNPRATPAIVYDGYLRVTQVNNLVVDGFSFNSGPYGPGWVEIVANKANHGLTDAQLLYTFTSTQHPLLFDFNL